MPSGPDSPARTGQRSPLFWVVALGVSLWITGLTLLATVDHRSEPALTAPVWVTALIALGFAGAERFVFHIEYRREAFSFTFAEVPTVLALAFLAPVVGTAARVTVSLLILHLVWRSAPHKLFFNAGLFTFESALAYMIVRVVFGFEIDDPATFLIVTTAAVIVSSWLGSFFVSAAIAAYEGDLLGHLREESRTNLVLTPTIGIAAAVVAAPSLLNPAFAVFAFVPIGAGWVIVQALGRLSQRHKDLQAIHGFSAAVGSSLSLERVATAAVEEASRLLRVDRGTLQIYDGETVTEFHVGGGVADRPNSVSDTRWEHLMAARSAVFVAERAGRFVADKSRRPTQMLAPIVDDDEILGALLVSNPTTVHQRLEPADRERAATLSQLLSHVIRRATLHARVEHAATHDVLTDDANRLSFERSINELLHGADQRWATGDETAAVLVLDLNRFKEVNDTLGHHVGDEVLMSFSKRLRSQLGPDDVLSRFGGDEFAALVRRPLLSDIVAVAEQIIAESFEPMNVGEIDVVVNSSIGIAIIEPDCTSGDELIRRADVAMYAAKRSHLTFELYRPEIDRRTPNRLVMVGDLRFALERGVLEVHYQPQVDLSKGAVVGAEALIRWERPGSGAVPPTEIVRIAEESGLITQLTDYVMHAAVRAGTEWIANGHRLSVAVNLSAHDLLDERLPNRVDQLLKRFQFPPQLLTLEITESALLSDTPRTKSTVERLRQLGIRLSLDDFGTGYSSLSYLRRLPVHELKVDASFVQRLLIDDQDAVIVRSTVDLGHHLGIEIVAEGLESMEIYDRLREWGCEIGQGYAIARPMPLSHFSAWLASTTYTVAYDRPRGMASDY